MHSLFDITAEEIRVSIAEERTDERGGSDEQLDKRNPEDRQDDIFIRFADPCASVSIIRPIVAPT